MNWRDMVAANPDMSAESMAATRIMKGMGAAVKDIGALCRRFGIEYRDDESPFQRAVKIMREVYRDMSMVQFVDAIVGDGKSDIKEDLLENPGTGIVFYREKGSPGMTAFVKGKGLKDSPLGQTVIRPGVKYIANRDGMELWEQDPVALVRSFSLERDYKADA